jgi:demethylmenaquinone methyltransferase/2-methoxy-6-polyprenyl-1,4-benzoquinol methylase
MKNILDINRCPECGSELEIHTEEIICSANNHAFPVKHDIPILLTIDDLKSIQQETDVDDMHCIAKYYNVVGTEYNKKHNVGLPGADWVMKNQTLPLFKDKLSGSDKVLEIGSGTGFLTSHLMSNGYNVIPTDISLTMLNVNKQSNNIDKAVVCNAEHLPFASDTFDCVVGNNTYYHYLNKEKVLQEIRRVLKKNGKMLFSEMNPNFPLWYTQKPRKGLEGMVMESEMYRRLIELKEEYFSEMLGNNGFELITYKPYSNTPYYSRTLLITAGAVASFFLNLMPGLQKYLAIRVFIEAKKID